MQCDGTESRVSLCWRDRDAGDERPFDARCDESDAARARDLRIGILRSYG